MKQLRTLLEKKGFYRIPLKKLATGHYKLTAKVNGKKGVFILDTGASTSCIGMEHISYFNLFNEESKTKAAGAGAINMITEIARKNTINMEKWSGSNIAFVLFDLSHVNEALAQANETPVHGIIGADLLKKGRAVIDYGRNVCYIL
jgi:hypothetical protein